MACPPYRTSSHVIPMSETRALLQEIIREVFERALAFEFATAEMSHFKEPDQNIDSFARLIDGKRRRG